MKIETARRPPYQDFDEEVEKVAWAILQALHENVPEENRPISWSDLKGDQDQRVRSAAIAAIECVRELDRIRSRNASL
jgi:hypothetical protein